VVEVDCCHQATTPSTQPSSATAAADTVGASAGENSASSPPDSFGRSQPSHRRTHLGGVADHRAGVVDRQHRGPHLGHDDGPIAAPGARESGRERPHVHAVGEAGAQALQSLDAEHALAAHGSGAEELPRRERAATLRTQLFLGRSELGEEPGAEGFGGSQARAGCGGRAAPERSCCAAEPLVERGGDGESVVAVAVVVADLIGEQRPHRRPRGAGQAERRGSARRVSEREVDADQRRRCRIGLEQVDEERLGCRTRGEVRDRHLTGAVAHADPDRVTPQFRRGLGAPVDHHEAVEHGAPPPS
jgi:hypothetical protein